jgi:hypothetical protein
MMNIGQSCYFIGVEKTKVSKTCTKIPFSERIRFQRHTEIVLKDYFIEMGASRLPCLSTNSRINKR